MPSRMKRRAVWARLGADSGCCSVAWAAQASIAIASWKWARACSIAAAALSGAAGIGSKAGVASGLITGHQFSRPCLARSSGATRKKFPEGHAGDYGRIFAQDQGCAIESAAKLFCAAKLNSGGLLMSTHSKLQKTEAYCATSEPQVK
jgi:hypothetical protein